MTFLTLSWRRFPLPWRRFPLLWHLQLLPDRPPTLAVPPLLPAVPPLSAVTSIKATLQSTHTAGVDAEKLATQLDQLVATLELPGVKGEAAKRGGPEAAAELSAGAATLRETDEEGAQPAGTPAETERLDHLDGIIVGLTRRARNAARSTAARLGKPALAAAFELDKLYPGASKKPEKAAPKSNGATPVADGPK